MSAVPVTAAAGRCFRQEPTFAAGALQRSGVAVTLRLTRASVSIVWRWDGQGRTCEVCVSSDLVRSYARMSRCRQTDRTLSSAPARERAVVLDLALQGSEILSRRTHALGEYGRTISRRNNRVAEEEEIRWWRTKRLAGSLDGDVPQDRPVRPEFEERLGHVELERPAVLVVEEIVPDTNRTMGSNIDI